MKIKTLLEDIDKSELLKKYKVWKTLVNMQSNALQKFLDSQLGKEAGLKKSEASKSGIGTGRESARAIIRMKSKNFRDWNQTDISWMNRQISFISRMSGNQGPLFVIKDGVKVPTRKLTSLWIWGHIPNGYSPDQN